MARRTTIAVLLAGVMAAIVAVVLRAPGPSREVADPYVGSAACGGCHARAFGAWQRSVHRLAMVAVGGDPAAKAPGDRPPLGTRDGQPVMLAEAIGAAADVPVPFVLGARHVEQYLGDLGQGRLQALTLAFDPTRAEWFDLAEGDGRGPDDWAHWSNGGMNANARCIFCHATGYEKGYDAATGSYRSSWHEAGVGCEACHGPGRAHLAARSHGGQDPYAKRSPAALFDACASCHSRRASIAPYTPGDDFLDAYDPTLPDRELYHPDGQIDDEVYEVVSFQMSRMYARGVRCWNCHDVHAGGPRAAGNTLCLGCHAAEYGAVGHTHHPATSPGATCVGCHMPTTTYMRRDPRHDHSFSRPDPEATLALGVPNACNRCHADRDARWAADRVAEWFPDGGERERRRAFARAIENGRRGDTASLPALVTAARGAGDAVRRATAARLLAQFPTSGEATDALLVAVHDAEPLVRAGSAWSLAQRSAFTPDVGAALLSALGDPVRGVRVAAALATPRLDSAVPAVGAAAREWEASQAIAAESPEAHYNLALFHAARGERDVAENEYRTALRLWPREYPARHNLAMLLAEEGRVAEAEAEFRKILDGATVPETAFALGLLYGEQGRWREATDVLARCIAAAPDYPRARYNLGLAYAKAGDTARAMDTLEIAAEDPATHSESVRVLVDLARDAKDERRLQRWVPEAAMLDPAVQDDPRLRELLAK